MSDAEGSFPIRQLDKSSCRTILGATARALLIIAIGKSLVFLLPGWSITTDNDDRSDCQRLSDSRVKVSARPSQSGAASYSAALSRGSSAFMKEYFKKDPKTRSFAKSKRIFRDALRNPGARKSDKLARSCTMNNLANCSFFEGSYSDAEAMYRQALENCYAPEKHPNASKFCRCFIMRNLMLCLKEQGKPIDEWWTELIKIEAGTATKSAATKIRTSGLRGIYLFGSAQSSSVTLTDRERASRQNMTAEGRSWQSLRDYALLANHYERLGEARNRLVEALVRKPPDVERKNIESYVRGLEVKLNKLGARRFGARRHLTDYTYDE